MDPICITQVLLFADFGNYSALGESLWAAMMEAEQFYASAGLISNPARYVFLPGTSPSSAMSTYLPPLTPEPLASKEATPFWSETRASYSKTYDQGRIVSLIRDKYLPQDRSASYLFVVTDQEIRPPKHWRYVLWDGVGSDIVLSVAPMDPVYWEERNSSNRTSVIKHRLRTALLNGIGERIGFSRCDNEECLLFGNVDSVIRLDNMLYFGSEHNVPVLTNRGFAAEATVPSLPQPIVENPDPPQSWGSYAR